MKNKHPKCHQTSPDHAKQTLLEGSPGKTDQQKKSFTLRTGLLCDACAPGGSKEHPTSPMATHGSPWFSLSRCSRGRLQWRPWLMSRTWRIDEIAWRVSSVVASTLKNKYSLKKNKNNHPSSLTGSSSQSTVFFVRLCEASHVVCVENVGWWQVFHFPNQQLAAEALSEISLVCCLILWLKTAKAKPWWAWNIVAFELHTNIVNIC